MAELTEWKVEGMTCSNCALSIANFLKKAGLQDIKVNPIDGQLLFLNDKKIGEDKLIAGIKGLGYQVVNSEALTPGKKRILADNRSRFLFCLPFTAVLMLHLLDKWIPLHWLMDPWLQMGLSLPVFILGMLYFGKSAINSLLNGMPNMNVLVALGALAAFAYSFYGVFILGDHNYMFFETSSSIITLVFLGNFLEERSIQSTQKAIQSLARSQKVMANMIAFDDQHKEIIFQVENSVLKTGDLLQINSGEQVPMDCKILWGECMVNEAIISGESKPLLKQKKEGLIGGSILESGSVKAQVTATGKDTVMAGILRMVRRAQGEKPPVQKMADRISAVFVPVVIGIAILTFLINYFGFAISTSMSLMRSIAVLVISCPCAMGLATPAAIAVGLGRGAKNGILFKNASALETFKDIKQVVFDKTGTLTTGQFSIAAYHSEIEETEFCKILYSLEKHSAHPLARTIAAAYKNNGEIQWKEIEEIKGLGIKGLDKEGNTWWAGSHKLLKEQGNEPTHSIYLLKNNEVIGWLDSTDEIRPEAQQVITWFRSKNIHTILLSGDKKENCSLIAGILGIDEVFSEQSPQQKLDKIAELTRQQPTAMVGDGINDAPALSKATLGISLSGASQIAMQSADVILLQHGLKNLPQALGLGKHTYLTIKQNLFWAFLYNTIAIPVAAMGMLTPTVSALSMAMSDIVLAFNSIRLFIKKVY